MSQVQGILGAIEENGTLPDIETVNGLGDQELVNLVNGLGALMIRKPSVSKAAQAVQKAAADALAIKASANTLKQHAGGHRGESSTDTGKTKFEKRISQIENKAIREGLEAKNLTVSDYEFYVVKAANGASTDMILESDLKKIGVTNLVGGQLPSGTAFLITHISLKEGVAGSPSADPIADGMTVDFGNMSINTRNGEFNLTNGQKVLIPASASCEVFRNVPVTEPSGYFKLEAPKVIQTAMDMKSELKLPNAPTSHTYFKLSFRGLITVKA